MKIVMRGARPAVKESYPQSLAFLFNVKLTVANIDPLLFQI
jgi:hypothetical protein